MSNTAPRTHSENLARVADDYGDSAVRETEKAIEAAQRAVGIITRGKRAIAADTLEHASRCLLDACRYLAAADALGRAAREVAQ